MKLSDLAGHRVVIWGAGREGTSAARHVSEIGIQAPMVVTNTEAAQAGVLMGAAALDALMGAEIVIRSPGISSNLPLVKSLEQHGVRMTTGTSLWLAEHGPQTIAVTGSKGKSTVTGLVYALLKGCGVDIAMGGNVGVPMLDLPKGKAAYAVEVSSFQAESVESSPRVGVLTAIFPEHLDWHGSLAAYIDAKLNLFAHGPTDLVANDHDEAVCAAIAGHPGPYVLHGISELASVSADGALTVSGHQPIAPADLPLAGRHNAINIALAMEACHLAFPDIGIERLAAELKNFVPLPHRLELVPSADDRRWVDDGLATNPQATIAALRVFDTDAVALILGGSDRGVDYSPLVRYLDERATDISIFTIPPSGRQMAAGISARHTLTHCANFAAAISAIKRDTVGGSVVLLSPGAPSFGEFADYRERSARFAEAAREA